MAPTFDEKIEIYRRAILRNLGRLALIGGTPLEPDRLDRLALEAAIRHLEELAGPPEKSWQEEIADLLARPR
jgi:hypothetical protein